MKKFSKREPEKKQEKKPEPKPAPKSSGAASASATPKIIWTGGLCECGKPVAPGQSEVCVEHQKSR